MGKEAVRIHEAAVIYFRAEFSREPHMQQLDQEKLEQTRMSLGEHLEELRRRLIYAIIGLAVATGAMFAVTPSLLQFLERPFVEVMSSYGLPPKLLMMDYQSGLALYMQIALYGGLVLASPWIFVQIWMFISAGLYQREKRYVVIAVPASATLFVAGAAFFLLLIAKPILYFFVGFNRWMGAENWVTFENHIDFMLEMMVIFGLAFQTPVVIFLLSLMGLVTTRRLNHYRRHVIIAIFILASIVMASPSPLDQIAMAVPMCLLYELGALLVYLRERRKRRSGALHRFR